jgi:hypothetical protein
LFISTIWVAAKTLSLSSYLCVSTFSGLPCNQACPAVSVCFFPCFQFVGSSVCLFPPCKGYIATKPFHLPVCPRISRHCHPVFFPLDIITLIFLWDIFLLFIFKTILKILLHLLLISSHFMLTQILIRLSCNVTVFIVCMTFSFHIYPLILLPCLLLTSVAWSVFILLFFALIHILCVFALACFNLFFLQVSNQCPLLSCSLPLAVYMFLLHVLAF